MAMKKYFAGLACLLLGASGAAAEVPAPFDQPGSVDFALVRFFSEGDFFEGYLQGVESQTAALGAELKVFDSGQDAELQAEMVDQAVALGVEGIIIQHGLPETMVDAARRAVAAGVAVVAFDVEVNHDSVPQIQQSDRLLARLVLEQAVADHGEYWQGAVVTVPGIAPLDRRHGGWQELLDRFPGIEEKAVFGTLEPPIAETNGELAMTALADHPDITVVFAPYDEFARGVKRAVEASGRRDQIKIYSADISTADILAMEEPGSPWVATAATNPVVVGQVCARALAMLVAGQDPGTRIRIPPTLITQELLREKDIRSMADLTSQVPAFASVDLVHPEWIPAPTPLP